MKKFKLNSPYKPLGDQPKAINSLVDGINKGEKEQTLLGVTGSGKTFTMANVIEKVQKPTLVISHNKTLAAQLMRNLRSFFQTMQLNILSVIMIIISLRHMFQELTLSLIKNHLSTKKST